MDEYCEALLRQIDSMPCMNIATVYFGGGTPSLLGSKRLNTIFNAICQKHRIADSCEITAEVNPGSTDKAFLFDLRSNGFNRLSIGMQAYDDVILASLGRLHGCGDFDLCYQNAGYAGFDNISLDMIFALPDCGHDILVKTVNHVTELAPKHISCYSLSIEENTPLFKNRNALHFPDEDDEEGQYLFICSAFSEYEHYEISSFAQPGYRSRHNSAYWNLNQYIGLGAGAHSYYNHRRFSSPKSIKAFISSTFKNDFLAPTDYYSSDAIKASETEEERIMLMLRTSEGASLNGSQRRKAAIYVDNGFGSFSGDRFILNDAGYRISNRIIGDILA